MAKQQEEIRTRGAVGDSGHADAARTDPNGAGTAVGVAHPENRDGGGPQVKTGVDLGSGRTEYDASPSGLDELPGNVEALRESGQAGSIGSEPVGKEANTTVAPGLSRDCAKSE